VKVTLGLILSHGFPVPVPFLSGWTRVLHQVLTGEGNAALPKDLAITESRVFESFGFPTDVARNELCRLFLDKDNAEYLLFLDADMVPPATIVHQLVRHRLPLVSGRYDLKKPPFHTVAMRKTGEGPHHYQSISKLEPVLKGLMPIDAAGAGALLIRRDVLHAVRDLTHDRWFAYQMDEKGLMGVSEDMWFFERAKECGFQAMLDADCYSRHIGMFEIDPSWQVEAYRSMKEIAARRDQVPA
jgi:hypothetical protein